MINKTDLFIYCDWLEENDVNSDLLRNTMIYFDSGVISSVTLLGCDINSQQNWKDINRRDEFNFGNAYRHASGDGDGYGDGDGDGDGECLAHGLGYGEFTGGGQGIGHDLEFD